MRPISEVGLGEARELVISSVRVLSGEEIPLADALGRVARGGYRAEVCIPPSDMSVMDGYCLDSASTRGASASAPVRLKVVGTIRAGVIAAARLGAGECMAIMTGAALPEGADAVVASEEVGETGEVAGAGEVVGAGEVAEAGYAVSVCEEIEPGRWVRKRGEVIEPESILHLEGKRVTPLLAGLLASAGWDSVPVTRRPLVGVLATGDELVPIGAAVGAASLHASNLTMLAGLVRQAGCGVVDAGICADSEGSILAGVERCKQCDAVVVTGGSGKGAFDLVPRALLGMGVRPVFRGVRMGPGKGTLFGVREGVAYFSLPGSPAAVLAAFHLIVRPGLLAMMGALDCRGRLVRARVAAWRRGPDGGSGRAHTGKWPAESARPGGFTRVIAARWAEGPAGDASSVEPLATRGGGDVVRLSDATCLIVLGEGSGAVDAGAEVDVLPIE